MKRLYLMRHGETQFNTQRIVQGRCDSPLTEAGRMQARQAGEKFLREGAHFDRVGSSPIKRAYDSCELALEAMEENGIDCPSIEVVQDLQERSYGPYEMQPSDTVPGGVWDPGENLVACGGEGSRALRERVVAACASLFDRDDVQCALAVSHGSASMQFYLASTRPNGLDGLTRLPNCCILVFDFDDKTRSFTLVKIL